MSIETVTGPVVAGVLESEWASLMVAAAGAGCSHLRTQTVGSGRLLVEFETTAEPASVVAALRSEGFAAVAGPPRPGFEVVWARRNAAFFYVEDACVCFPWSPLDRSTAARVIEIDPGAGFGSGQHPTTVLLLRWLATADLLGRSVLDVGCGTGVLAIAAALGGADRVVGVDVAEAAELATKANAVRNGVADRVSVVAADLASLDDGFEVVLANIHAPILIELAPQLRRLVRPGGSLLLSGLSPAQPSTVMAAMRPLRLVAESELDEWVALELAE